MTTITSRASGDAKNNHVVRKSQKGKKWPDSLLFSIYVSVCGKEHCGYSSQKCHFVAAGRRKFVFDCGVIGFCPPCTRATSLAGVGSLLVGGWAREPCAHARESKPTRQQGFCALLMGGCARESKPTRQQGSCALLAGGFNPVTRVSDMGGGRVDLIL